MSTEEYCTGVPDNKDPRCICNHGALGPTNVFDGSAPAALLEGYQRTGSMNAKKFLATWSNQEWNERDRRYDTKWKWPNGNYRGFTIDPISKKSTEKTITLEAGTLIDRFGEDDTIYFAPFGTPFAQRSLPPSSLNPEQVYTVYEVVKSFQVDAGLIEPGFEQPGGGIQYIARLEKENPAKEEIKKWFRDGPLKKLSSKDLANGWLQGKKNVA